MERHRYGAIGTVGKPCERMNFPEIVAPRRTTMLSSPSSPATLALSIMRSYFWKKRRIDVYTFVLYAACCTYIEFIHPSIHPSIVPASQPLHSTPLDSIRIRIRTWILRTFTHIRNISQRQFYLCAHC